MRHRVAFSIVKDLSPDGYAKLRDAEIENARVMLSALSERRKWVQSPSGFASLERVENATRAKLKSMEAESRMEKGKTHA
jgi:hypothetical protein